MLILASNQPDQFDWAINDRLDDLIEFSLPTFDERYRMLKQYFAQVFYFISSCLFVPQHASFKCLFVNKFLFFSMSCHLRVHHGGEVRR